MPKYAALLKYTAETMENIRAEGYASRPRDLTAFAESLGGSVELFQYISTGEWDVLMVFDVPVDGFLAMTSVGNGAGAVERSVIYELHSAEAIDAAITAHPATAYRRPGD